MKIRPWSPEDTAHGRKLLSAAFVANDEAKLEEFYAWLEVNVIIDVAVVRSTMDKVFQASDTSRAVRIYDATMLNYNPIAQVMLKAAMVLAAASLVYAAIVYFFIR